MRTPHGLDIIESCHICPLRHDRIFCDLPLPDLEALQAMSSLATYPRGSILFVEGQEARGVFILCNGRVKLNAGSADGKSLIMRIAEAGESKFSDAKKLASLDDPPFEVFDPAS
jgi:CRP/FNR family transcriptional regulator, cyclic AMP receptor protein